MLQTIFIEKKTYIWAIQEQIVAYNIKSKYPEDYSTVDRVGREKLLAWKSCSV